MRILKLSKAKTLLVGIMMMTILLCCGSQVQAAHSRGFTYTVTDGKAEILGYPGVITTNIYQSFNKLSAANASCEGSQTSLADATALSETNGVKILVLTTDSYGINNTSLYGLSDLAVFLRAKGYSLDEKNCNPITLAELSKYDIVFFAFLNRDISSLEAQAIATYVQNGGSLYLQGESNLFMGTNFYIANKIADYFGIEFIPGPVCDDNHNQYGRADRPIFTDIRSHEITNGVTKIVMYWGTSLKVNNSAGTVVAYSDSDAYLDLNGSGTYNRGEPKGAVPVLAVSEYGKGKIVAYGDSGFLGNSDFKDNQDHHNLASNIFSWLSSTTEPNISVISVSLNKSKATVTKGNAEQLVATISPSNATNKKVSWVSSDPSVATVNSTGLVTALNPGITAVMVSTEDGNKTATCIITVTDNTELQLDYLESVSVIFGKTLALRIYEVQTDQSKIDITQSVTLTSDDPDTATVTRGKINGISVGETIVRGTYNGQDIEISVTVTPPVIKLSADPSVLNLNIDATETITLTATYKDTTEAVVSGSSATWKSSNPNVATVNEFGEVTGVAIGSTTITGTFGGKTATITVNVIPELDHILVRPGSVGVAKGKTQAVNIFAVYVDGSKVDITKTIRLTSDDKSVATVTGATIKGLTADCDTTVRGSYLDQDIEIPVKVTQPLKTLAADTGTSGLILSIDEPETVTLTATYSDGSREIVNEYATGVSSKPSVAIVDIDGESITVTGVAPGSATISLSYEGKKVIVKVNVTE